MRFRTGIPNNEKFFTLPKHDWMNLVYRTQPLDCGEDMYPIPLGNLMRITSFVDAYLGYCKMTGKFITGIIHLLNQTPVKYFCKLQNTVETPTYGLEFVVPSKLLSKLESYKRPSSS